MGYLYFFNVSKHVTKARSVQLAKLNTLDFSNWRGAFRDIREETITSAKASRPVDEDSERLSFAERIETLLGLSVSQAGSKEGSNDDRWVHFSH